jgi:two-component system, NarL family, response regulator NreC
MSLVQMSTVALADDHALVRAGLRRILEHGGNVVVGEAGDGLQVVPMVEKTRPQVLLLDLGLPGLHGLDVLREVTRRVPGTRVLVVSAFGRDDFVVNAFRNGAAGYLLKGAGPEELLTALEEVARGGYYVSTTVSRVLAKGLGDSQLADDPYDDLTPRERQVFMLMAEGLTNSAVGKRLNISTRTAESHRQNIMRKLDLGTQTDVVLYALRRGILGFDDPPDDGPIN